MQIITAPSKTQSPPQLSNEMFSQPLFLDQAEKIVEKLRTLSFSELQKLMNTSDKLTQSTLDKIQSFSTPFTAENSSQALFTFKGDAYSALHTASYTKKQLAFAQETLIILSGLYGLLRPLDLMQPYRLEMGAKLHLDKCTNLYQFWRETITETINQALRRDKDQSLINLASAEYANVVIGKKLKGKMISIVFRQNRNGLYKTVPIFSKKARGMMIDFAISNCLKNSEDLKSFSTDEYTFNKQESTETSWVFHQQE